MNSCLSPSLRTVNLPNFAQREVLDRGSGPTVPRDRTAAERAFVPVAGKEEAVEIHGKLLSPARERRWERTVGVQAGQIFDRSVVRVGALGSSVRVDDE